ncbi:MAG: hypothetical protein AAFR38_06430 [Planctomycetota bacterium]
MKNRSIASVLGVSCCAALGVGAGLGFAPPGSQDAAARAVAAAETGSLSVTVNDSPLVPGPFIIVVDGPDGRTFGGGPAGVPVLFSDLTPGDYTVSSSGASADVTVIADQTTSVTLSPRPIGPPGPF